MLQQGVCSSDTFQEFISYVPNCILIPPCRCCASLYISFYLLAVDAHICFFLEDIYVIAEITTVWLSQTPHLLDS